MSISKTLNYNQLIPEKRCRKCHKKFIAAPEHRYREGSAFYCSWHCYLHRHDKEAVKNDQGTTETIQKHKSRD